MIHELVLTGMIEAHEQERAGHGVQKEPRLWCSDLGKCPTRVMLRVLGVQGGMDFPPKILKVFALGNAYEDVTLRWLQAGVEGKVKGSVTEQQVVRTAVWSGKIDFLVELEDGMPIIVEHKATGDKWWDYHGNLPKSEHICQAWLYGQLYHELCGVEPSVVLYYSSWTHYAEFVLRAHTDGIRAEGTMDDEPISRWVWLKPQLLREELELAFRQGVAPDPRPGDKGMTGCTFKGAPSCPYYDHCWRKKDHHWGKEGKAE